MFNFIEINRDSIIKEGNPILRMESEDITFPLSDANKVLVKKMNNYLIESNNDIIAEMKKLDPAVGIAAPQVGSNVNIFSLIMEDENEQLIVKNYFNPKILNKSEQLTYLCGGEGCLSVPIKKDGYIYRPHEIDVQYQNDKGQIIKEKLNGVEAIVFQHEFDHLKGVLYVDYIKNDPFIKIENAIEY